MPKRVRRIRGGVQGTVNSASGSGSGSGSGDISFNIKDAPSNIRSIKSNPNQVVTIAFLFIIFILVVLMRQLVEPGIIQNKLSISIVAFTLGAGLIGYYLLIGGNQDGLITDMYLYFSILIIGYWLWLLLFVDGFVAGNGNKDDKEEQEQK